MDMARHTWPTMDETASNSKELVSEYPASSVLLSFALGCGVGLILATWIGTPQKPRSYSSQAASVAESFGRQVLAAISEALPASLAKHIQS